MFPLVKLITAKLPFIGTVIIGLLFVSQTWPIAAKENPAKTDASDSTSEAPSAPVSSAASSRVEIVPASVELRPTSPARALLILRNVSSSSLEGVKVTPIVDDDLNVVGQPAFERPQTIVPKGAFAWVVEITSQNSDPVTGRIVFRIEHLLGPGGSSPVPQVTYAVLQAKSRDLSDVAEIKLETALESLDQQHPGRVHLIISNKSDQSMSLKREEIAWDKPPFIDIPPDATGTAVVLAPRQTVVVSFDVRTADRVQPGKHLLVARVPFEWAGGTQKGSIVVTREVQVGVLGESTVLKLLAIPSFLIIPGFLGVIIWGVLWKWGLFKTNTDTGDFPLDFSEKPSNPQFWVAAITISIPTILFYRYTINRDVLSVYGLSDLVAIWLASVLVLGLGGYALIIGGRRSYLKWITPSENDKEIDVLKKLGRQGLGVFVDRVEFGKAEEGGTKPRALRLQKADANRAKTWIGPPIKLTWSADVPDHLKTAVDNELKAGGQPGKIAEAVEKAGPKATLKWDSGTNGIDQPIEIATKDLTVVDQVQILFVG